MSPASEPLLPAAFRRFIELFNREAYWESHEALEGAWRENGSGFYKGLILYASAFVHVQRGNPHGIVAQLVKAERELRTYRPAYMGLDVEALLAHASQCGEVVAGHPDTLPDAWPRLIPRIRLAPDRGLLRGDEPELADPLDLAD